MEHTLERRLAAIVAMDMVGFSRLVGLDEEGTIARQQRLKSRNRSLRTNWCDFHGQNGAQNGQRFLCTGRWKFPKLKPGMQIGRWNVPNRI